MEFEIPDGPAGLSFSSGIESSFLLYILAEQISSPIHLFTVAMKSCDFHSLRHSTDIIQWVLEKTGNDNIIQHVVIKDNHEDGAGELYNLPLDFLENKHVVNSMMTGSNSMPSGDLKHMDKDSYFYKSRSPDVVRKINFREQWYSPLTNLDKRQVADLYRHYNIMDLAHITNSCHIPYGEDPCGKCFSCEEKFLGFGFY